MWLWTISKYTESLILNVHKATVSANQLRVRSVRFYTNIDMLDMLDLSLNNIRIPLPNTLPCDLLRPLSIEATDPILVLLDQNGTVCVIERF